MLVVSPAVNESPVAFWVSDSDEAIDDADVHRAGRPPTRWRRRAPAPAREAGESEPLLALQDALTTFPADRVLVFARGDESARYREDDIAGEAERRFGVPVTEVTR